MSRRPIKITQHLTLERVSLAILSVAWIFVFSLTATAGETPRKVLIFSSDDPHLPALITLNRTIRASLNQGSPLRVQFYDEAQRSFRIPHEKYDTELVTMLKKKYEGEKIDLIYAIGLPALRFMNQHKVELFPGVPLIFIIQDRGRIADLTLNPDVTGVVGVVELASTLEMALALQPETRKAVVITDQGVLGSFLLEQAHKEFQPYEGRIDFTYITDITMDDLLTRVASLPKDCIIFFLSFSVDKNGMLIAGPDALSLIHQKSPVSIYGASDTYLNYGIVGGRLLSYEALGLQAGDMGLQIFSGRAPKETPIRSVPSVTMADWRELRRWGIDEAKLPTGTVVKFKEPTFWQQYKARIIGAAALIVLESLLILWLLITRLRRRQVEIENHRLAVVADAERRHLDEVISNVPGIVWESHVRPGSKQRTADFVSEYVEKMLGYTVEEWLATPGFWLSIIPEEDRELAATCSDLVFETGTQDVVRFRWITKDGRVLWVEEHLEAIRDQNGITIGLRGVTLNITERLAAEQALKENEAQLAGIIGSAMDAIISIDEQQNVVLFNAAAEKMFGCSVSQALHRPLTRFVSVASGNGLSEDTLAIGSSGSLTGRRANGESFPIESSVSRLELDGNTLYTIILRDITERLGAEETLRERKQELTAAQQIAKVGSWEWDAALDIVNWSDEMYRVSGCDATLPPPSFAESGQLFTPESWHLLKTTVESTLQTGTPYELELELIRPDGVHVWTNAHGEALRDPSGKVYKLRGTLQDINARKQAEEALRQAIAEVSRLKNQLHAENIYLQEEIKLEHNFSEIIGQSDALKYVLFKVEQVAPTDSTVLVLGETGTGKELVARAIHGESLRKDRPLVKVNCAALSANLIESELFGHEKGAFTGALIRKLGRFEVANGATIFLDEIGELPHELQSKLLRVIQEGEFERLGGSKTISVDVRIIAATNRNLKAEVQKGTFREDLWYRLNVFPITVPPLRQREDDVPALVEHFVQKFSKKFGKEIKSIAPVTMTTLRKHSWPGNVRELANVIERAVINTNGSVLSVTDQFAVNLTPDIKMSVKTLEQIEREYIINTLEHAGWRIEGPSGAAKILGLNPSTLRTRMSKMGIQKQFERMRAGAKN